MITAANQVIERKLELQEYYRSRDTNMAAWRKMALSKVDNVGPSSDTMNTNLPTAHSIVLLAHGMITTQTPRVRVKRKSESKSAQDNAEKLQKFLAGAWYRNERERHNFPLQRAAWNAVVDGWFCFKVLWDVDAEEKGNFPIYIGARDPAFVYPQPTDQLPEYVIESYERPVGEIRSRWGEVIGGSILPGRRDTDRVTWTEYWDEERCIYLVENTEILNVEHGYGFLPYTIGYGYHTPLITGETVGIGILAPIADALRHQQRLFANESAIVEKYAWPTILAESPQGDKLEIDMHPGAINYLMPGESVTYLEWKSTLPEIKQLADELNGYIDRATFSGVQYGEKQPSGTSGYLGSILASATQIKINPVKRGIEFGMEDVNEKVLRLVERMLPEGETLSVDGEDHRQKQFDVSIKAKDIAGYYNNSVKLQPTLPEDESQKGMIALRLVQANILSKATAREKYLDLESPEDEEEAILREKVIDHPLMTASLGLRAARSWGLDVKELQAQLDAAKQVNDVNMQGGEEGLPTGPGGPPVGGPPTGGPPGGGPPGGPGGQSAPEGGPGAIPTTGVPGGRSMSGMPPMKVPAMARMVGKGNRPGPMPGTGGRPPAPSRPPVGPPTGPPRAMVRPPQMPPPMPPAMPRPVAPGAATLMSPYSPNVNLYYKPIGTAGQIPIPGQGFPMATSSFVTKGPLAMPGAPGTPRAPSGSQIGASGPVPTAAGNVSQGRLTPLAPPPPAPIPGLPPARGPMTGRPNRSGKTNAPILPMRRRR